MSLPARLKQELPETPAFVYDITAVEQILQNLAEVTERSGLRVLFSVKALPFLPLLRELAPKLDGFSVSSLFEARLSREALPRNGSLHITTPGFKPDEIEEIAELCAFVSFNSLSQFYRFSPCIAGRSSLGLRINPQRSFLADPRYDPCRVHSKLGTPLQDFVTALCDPTFVSLLSGIHFHTSFDASDFEALAETVDLLQSTLGNHLQSLQWINLGGGYRLRERSALEPLATLAARLRSDYGLTVYFEPGKGIIGDAGYLVASVIDVFTSDGKCVAILDTSVNHLPEVFEYQISPLLAEHDPEGDTAVILAGATCLAGDLFGTYRLHARPRIGDRFVFQRVGAYSLIKANRFNGHNLPSIYRWNGRELTLEQRYLYCDYRRHWSGETQ
ncbi:MAG TPA: carboxynorspermidine decarboxylase [Methylococcus sp.]|nr:carboxynorspermidine decarboxylase [Methylococcus sp.]